MRKLGIFVAELQYFYYGCNLQHCNSDMLYISTNYHHKHFFVSPTCSLLF